jgi:hypothetical protein
VIEQTQKVCKLLFVFVKVTGLILSINASLVKNMKHATTFVIAICCAVAVFPRLLQTPLPWNFSALAGLALLCGSVIRRPWLAVLIPLGCRIATDLVIEGRTGYGLYPSIAFDYAAYGLIVGLGRMVQPRKWWSVLGSGIASAVIFFLVSNFGVWAVTGEQVLHGYSNDFRGLMECYLKGIPFARGTFAGDVIFSCAFFGVWALAANQVATQQLAASDRA